MWIKIPQVIVPQVPNVTKPTVTILDIKTRRFDIIERQLPTIYQNKLNKPIVSFFRYCCYYITNNNYKCRIDFFAYPNQMENNKYYLICG